MFECLNVWWIFRHQADEHEGKIFWEMIVYGNVSIESWSRFFETTGFFQAAKGGLGLGLVRGRGEGGGEEIHHINNREAPRKVLITPREETNRGVAGAFLTIIDTTYARQFPPTHQQDDGAFFNFFPRALTGTKQQQLREVCADKQCKTKTGDLPPHPHPLRSDTSNTFHLCMRLAPISPKTPQGFTLKSCHRKKKKEKKRKKLTWHFGKKKKRISFQPYCKAIFWFQEYSDINPRELQFISRIKRR